MPESSPAPAKRAPRAPRMPKARLPAPTPALSETAASLDTRYLETLLGYNARRTALSVITVFLRRMAPFDLRPVDFSVLTLIAHNPGATSRQICAALDILPPNLVGLIRQLEARSLVQRKPHPTDRRAQGLHLSAAGKRLQRLAEAEATRLESEVAGVLSPKELDMLNHLLRRVYQSSPGTAPCG